MSISVSPNSQRHARFKADCADELGRPPRVIELDWNDADNDDRPEIWDSLVAEGRTIVAADVVSLANQR